MPVAEADAEAAAAAPTVAGASPSARNDDPTTEAADRLAASTPSTPTTATSPVSPTFLSVAGRASTPLSLFVDSAPSTGKKKKTLLSPSSPTSSGSETAAELRQRYLAMSPTATSGGAPGTRDGESMRPEADRMRQQALQEGQQQEQKEEQDKEQHRVETGWREKSTGTDTGAGTRTGPPLPWSPSSSTSIGHLDSNIAASSSTGAGDIDKHDSGLSRSIISAPLPQSPNARARRGQHERPSTAARDSDIATITGNPDLRASNNNNSSSSGTGNQTAASPGSATARIPAPEDAPLHTGSVQPGTKLAHPKPGAAAALQPTGKKSPNNLAVEDETLGQRRRRLQAEREAREREMSYGNLTGERPVSYGNATNLSAGKGLARRVSMADMLSVHQNIQDPRAEEQRRRQQEQMRIAEQEARMAAVRAQMPTTLVQPGNARTGGFKGGLYNDGTGGLGLEAARSSVALNTLQTRSFTNTGPARNRATMMGPPTTGYGMPQGGLQPSYSTMTGFNGMGAMGGMNTMSMYGAGNLYGANGVINQGIPMSNPNGSMDRVERWRQGVFP
ncbi:hypothetical protein M440DRAFT_1392683 [Trichoderma longibrachiatum ATCC 18648]|uniref:Uncharacterized protein n=1 Tax=Trichoderma longibrachiatum ATCC 18648 TaxID=983965 RepID=A0A2T4C0Z2_TRILO|nr:hypothetical protein M440DRAFT_1392683 [Trichoderma longibrachiatum ATCC 18648]